MAVKPGIYAASMSVFNEDLSLNIDNTIRHAERLIKEGCHGVVFWQHRAGTIDFFLRKKKIN